MAVVTSIITRFIFKLNYVHRMMSRVVFVLLCVHAGSEVVWDVPYVKHALKNVTY